MHAGSSWIFTKKEKIRIDIVIFGLRIVNVIICNFSKIRNKSFGQMERKLTLVFNGRPIFDQWISHHYHFSESTSMLGESRCF